MSTRRRLDRRSRRLKASLLGSKWSSRRYSRFKQMRRRICINRCSSTIIRLILKRALGFEVDMKTISYMMTLALSLPAVIKLQEMMMVA